MITVIKRFVPLATLAILYSGASYTGTPNSAIPADHKPVALSQTAATSADAIRNVLNSQQIAWNRADIPAFLTGYWNSPELTFAGSEGIVRGYDGLLTRYRRSYPNKESMGELTFSGLEIRDLGPDAALVFGHWQLKRPIGGVGGVFTLVFRRFPNGWRIIHDHTSAQK